MDAPSTENLKIVRDTNQEMLDYFNDCYVRKLEQVQSLKTEQFELKVKIDELVKTRDVYSFKTSTGHNVFSPFSTTTTSQQEKATQIETQLHDLMDVKLSLDNNISKLETEIDDLKNRLSTLSTANKKLNELLAEQEEEALEKAVLSENENTSKEEETEHINHGINVLMMNQYDKKQLAQKISKSVLELLDSNLNKLDVLSWMLKSDVNRAKITLNEIIDSTEQLADSLDTIISELSNEPDTNEPIWSLLDDMILEYKEAHPECVIESDIDCPDYDLNLPPIITIHLLAIIKEIFDNAFRHSNANRITANILISNQLVDVFINDNGVGIDSNYTHLTPWYSGLHKVQETIYLLNGQFKIDGDLISGTNVRFSFPIDNESK